MVLTSALAWIKNFPNLRGKKAFFAWGAVGVFLFLIGGGGALAYYHFFSGPQVSPEATVQDSSSASPKAPVEAHDIAGPINGILFTSDEAAVWKNRTPLAIIVENHVDSRPQSGLSSADLVYEALAEGGITRQMAVFLTNAGNVTVGPVRSMRVYFLDWLEEYNAIAAHVGGNHHALDRIGPEGVKDLNQFYFSTFYWRSTDRFAPHNVYTTTEKLWLAGANKGYTGAQTFHSYQFKDDAVNASRPQAQTISLSFLGQPDYQVLWKYDQVNNVYLRNVGGSPAIDRNNNQQIVAKIIAVQVIPYSIFNDDQKGALLMQDTGSGKAYVFEDGITTAATWTKNSRSDRTIFTDSSGKEIPFNRGQIWVEVVPPASTVSASN
jgi:Protein of unknown function (DUF3048) N-terminal domain/Protein of unknown function (DUF3048) C-terminal domain